MILVLGLLLVANTYLILLHYFSYNFQKFTFFLDLKSLVFVSLVKGHMSHDIRGIPKAIYIIYFKVSVTLLIMV